MTPRFIVAALALPMFLLILVRSSAESASTAAAAADPNVATVVRVASLGSVTARAVVIRRPGPAPQNLILVTAATTAPDLAKAVGQLMQSRRRSGATVVREQRAYITPAAPNRQSADVRRAAFHLRRLARARDYTVPGIGVARALSVRLAEVARN